MKLCPIFIVVSGEESLDYEKLYKLTEKKLNLFSVYRVVECFLVNHVIKEIVQVSAGFQLRRSFSLLFIMVRYPELLIWVHDKGMLYAYAICYYAFSSRVS